MAATNTQSNAVGVQTGDRASPDDLITLDKTDAIRCENPGYSAPGDPYEWYYALEQGELTIYHRDNYFRPDATVTESKAQVVVQSAPVSEVVDRGELVAAQRRVSRE